VSGDAERVQAYEELDVKVGEYLVEGMLVEQSMRFELLHFDLTEGGHGK
jgi:hypothetical protein